MDSSSGGQGNVYNTYNVHVGNAGNVTTGSNYGTTNQGSTTTPATAPNQGSWLFQNHGKEATGTPTGALSVWGALRDTLVYMLGSTGAKQRERGAELSDANFIMPLMDDPAELPPHRHSPIFHIYVRALLAEGYGLPCWNPAPSDPEAQPKGVVPGDVGTYTAEGGFRRTFNLFDNADVIHKIAQRTQTCIQVSHCNPSPETFTRPGMLPKGEVMVEGASSRKPSYSPPPMDVVYEFRRFPDAPDGAILALTSSADKEETTSLDEMGRYINQHAEAIYRHATTIHPIGKDESLYIVTGCIKSDSWAMAAYRHGMDPRHDTLRLEPVRKAYGGYPPRYKWAEQGSSRAHVGRSDRRCVKDQVLFLLGFKVAFSKPFRNRIEVDLNSRADNSTSPGSGGPDTGDHHDQSSTFGRGSPSGYSLGRGSGGGSASDQAHHTGRNRGCTLSSQPSDSLPQKPKTGCSNDTHDVPCEPSPHSGETYDVEGYHPSDAINALLLQQTGCDIAVCHDDSWRLLLQSCHSLLADNKALTLEDLSTRVGESANRTIGVENGVAFLLPENAPMATTSQDVGAPREFMLSNSNGVAVQHFGLGTGKVAGERNEGPHLDLTRDQPSKLHLNIPNMAPHTNGAKTPAPSGTTVPFQLRPTDVVVLVMGIVGAGRSTFINALLPANHMEKKMAVGPSGSLAACTKTAECVVLDSDDLALILGHKPNYRLVLVDTPGFDSADKTDSDGVLKEIVEWSKSWLPPGQKCCGGVIFMHDLSIDRFLVQSDFVTASKTLKSCSASTHVAVVTSKWEYLESPIEGESRHNLVKEKIKEAKVHKFQQKDTDAQEIIKEFLPDLSERGGELDFQVFKDLQAASKVMERTRKRNLKEGARKFFGFFKFWRRG